MRRAMRALPLHVATAVFTAVWLHVRLQWIGLGAGWRAVNLLWC